MAERCRATGEAVSTVTCSLKSSLEPRVLDHLAYYTLRKDPAAVSDADIRRLVEEKLGRVVNDHVPDIVPLFKERLLMDLQQADIEARVASYYMDFDTLVDENGLTAMMGRGPTGTEAGRQRMKLRCKILMMNLQPEVLRVEIACLADLTHRHVRADDIALHDLVVE